MDRWSHSGCSPRAVWSSLKYPILGETEAGSKAPAIRDVSQDSKAEIPGLSQPGCCLCRELGYPQRRAPVLGTPAGAVLPSGNAAVGDGEGKTKITRPYISLPLKTRSHSASSAHTARGGHLGGNSEPVCATNWRSSP